jgi:hypothetical protein
MKRHRLICLGVAAAALLAGNSASLAEGDKGGAAKWRVPRTGDGHPDLQGLWTNATITPLERPEQFGQRLVLNEAEARALEQAEADYNAEKDAPSDLSEAPTGRCRSGTGASCGYNNFWIDRGSQVAVYNGQQRSSLIVDPPSGKVPALTPQRQRSMAARAQTSRNNFDGPEARSLGERCLLAFGSSSGPPMLPVLYNNHYQIVQNRDHVMILVEMVHDARIIRLGGKHPPPTVRKYMGDSIGRWEGDTLVVETTNFTDREAFRGATENLKVVERFTRAGPATINYRFTIEDPAAFTQSWSGEIPFNADNDKIYEYACHEGNYALPGILAGAREEEKAKAAADKSSTSR